MQPFTHSTAQGEGCGAGRVPAPRQEGEFAVPPPESLRALYAYFAGFCAEPGCPRCGGLTVYALKSGRLRCRDCGYTYHRFSRRFISRSGLPLEYWHAVLHYFLAGFSPQETAHRLALKVDTVFKAFGTIRLAIVAATEDGCRLLDARGEPARFCPNLDLREGEARQLCLSCRSPVLGIRETDERVRIELLPGLTAQGVFGMPLPLKTWRTFVFSGRFQDWQALIFCCCRTARDIYQAKFTRDALPLEQGAFHAFAEQWFARYHCPAPETSCTYLKELELRFNHRHEPLYHALAKALCGFVPKRGD